MNDIVNSTIHLLIFPEPQWTNLLIAVMDPLQLALLQVKPTNQTLTLDMLDCCVERYTYNAFLSFVSTEVGGTSTWNPAWW